jgi:branched-chain amino acid transport system substrate-binding protein
MKLSKLMLLVALLATVVLVVSACGGGAAAPTTAPATAPSGGTQPTSAPSGGAGGVIKVISSTPLTGGDSPDGIAMANSAKMAFEKHGAKAGNYTLSVVIKDDASAARGAWDPDVETSNANAAVSDPTVIGYLGTYNSGAAKLSIPILNQAGMVMVSAANTAIALTKNMAGVTAADEPNKYYPTGIRNYVRVCPADDLQGAVDANWAKALGVKAVYVLHDQQLYGKGIADRFVQVAKGIGINVLGEEGIDVKASDYSSQATKIVSAGADGFFMGAVSSSHAGLVWKALKSAGFKGIMMGPDGILSDDFLKEAGADAEGTYLSFAGLPSEQLVKVSPEGKQWHDDYLKEFGKEPGVYGAYGYEAALVMLKAIDTCVANNDVTRKCVRDTVFATKDFKGILGVTWSFDANGDTTVKTMTHNQVVNGQFKFLEVAQ